MEKERLCCNCLHCARWRTKKGIECHCDLNDKYLGYLQVMDEENDCKHWEKETKWDLQREHDKQIMADAIDELVKLVCEYYTMQERAGYCADTNNMIKQRIADFAEQVKEQKNDI